MSENLDKKDFPGRKYDEGKLRYDLIPPEALRGLAEVYTIGAKKYSDRNWEKGISYSRLIGALLRHLVDGFMMGEDIDPENKQRHIDSVVWNAVALSTFEARGMGAEFDDIPTRKKKETKNEDVQVLPGSKFWAYSADCQCRSCSDARKSNPGVHSGTVS